MTGSGATGNQVLGNYIGTNRDGTATVKNTLYGVYLNSAGSNSIGGTDNGMVM